MEEFKIGDMVKSNFNGVISEVTETGWEESGTVSLDTANKSGDFVKATTSESTNLCDDRDLCMDIIGGN